MNRAQRRATAANIRHADFDYASMARNIGLPAALLSKLPTRLRAEIAHEVCSVETAPDVAKYEPRKVARWIHRHVEMWFEHPGLVEPVACRAGCAHCCQIVPEISAGETLILQEAIGRLPEPAQRVIEGKLMDAAQAVRQAGSARAAFPLRCPLLGADDQCSVYQDRPAVCRAWASKDALACQRGSAIPNPSQSRWAKASLTFLQAIFKLKTEPLPVALTKGR